MKLFIAIFCLLFGLVSHATAQNVKDIFSADVRVREQVSNVEVNKAVKNQKKISTQIGEKKEQHSKDSFQIQGSSEQLQDSPAPATTRETPKEKAAKPKASKFSKEQIKQKILSASSSNEIGSLVNGIQNQSRSLQSGGTNSYDSPEARQRAIEAADKAIRAIEGQRPRASSQDDYTF